MNLESFIELKATKRSIGLGSFDGQIRTQIQAAKRAGVPELIFITTYGVNLTKPLHEYATQQSIQLTHYWAQYRVVNGQMQTNYIRVK